MTFFRPSNDDLLGDAKHDRTSEADSIPAIYNANARLSIEQQRVRLPIRFASSTFSSRALCCVCSLTRATPQQTQSSAERAALSRRDARHGRCGGRDRLRQVDTTAAVLARSRLDGRRSHDSSDAGEFCRVPFHSLFFSFFLLVDVCLIHLNFFVTTHDVLFSSLRSRGESPRRCWRNVWRKRSVACSAPKSATLCGSITAATTSSRRSNSSPTACCCARS